MLSSQLLEVLQGRVQNTQLVVAFRSEQVSTSSTLNRPHFGIEPGAHVLAFGGWCDIVQRTNSNRDL